MSSIELNDIGKIKQILIPAGWEQQHPPAEDLFSQAWEIEFESIEDRKIKLGISYRGMPIDKQSALAFHALSKLKPSQNDAEELSAQEIVSLRILMGFETYGNNQHTNPVAANNPAGRTFEISLAQMQKLSNNIVLYIDGRFCTGYYSGSVFFPVDQDGQIIHEIYLHAPELELFQLALKDFNSALDSIEWKN